MSLPAQLAVADAELLADFTPNELAYLTALAVNGPCTCIGPSIDGTALCTDEEDHAVSGACHLCVDLPGHLPCPAEVETDHYPTPAGFLLLAVLRIEHHRFVDEVRAVLTASDPDWDEQYRRGYDDQAGSDALDRDSIRNLIALGVERQEAARRARAYATGAVAALTAVYARVAAAEVVAP